MNAQVVNSALINSCFNLTVCDYGLTKLPNKFGKFGLGKTFRYIRSFLQVIFQVCIKRFEFCYITIQPYGFGFLKDALFVWVMKLFGQKVLIHLHGKGIRQQAGKSKRWLRIYQKVFKKTGVICLTPSLTEDIENVYKGTPFIVPNGIPVNNFDFTGKGGGDSINILFLSNLFVDKGVLDFLEAIRLLAASKTNFIAHITGAETDEMTFSQLKQLIYSYNLSDQVVITGPLYGEDKLEMLSQTDILVFPTKYANETFGIVNIEAMEAAIPVITTKVGGISDVVKDGETGFLVETNKPEMVTEKLELLLENPHLIDQLGKNGRERFLKHYTIDIFEKNLLEVFQAQLK